VIQDLSGSWRIKGTGESTLVMDQPVPLMHHDPDRYWITDPALDHPEGRQPKLVWFLQTFVGLLFPNFLFSAKLKFII